MDKRLEKTIRKVSYELREQDGTKRISGVAANSSTYDMGTFTESIAPGAWGDLSQYDVRALINHDNNKLLARSKFGKGSLQLEESAGELRYSFPIPNTSDGVDALELLKRGDISESSWQFSVSDDTWDFSKDKPHRTITKVADVRDVSLVTFPANPTTTVELRSMEEAKKALELNKNTMEEKNNQEAAAPVVEKREEKAQESKEHNFVDASAVGSTVARSEHKNLKGFNVQELVHQLSTGRLSGIYAELDQEGRSERAKSKLGIQNDFSFHLPEEMRTGLKKDFEARQNTVTAGTQPAQGANTVTEELKEFVRFLYPDTPVTNLCQRVSSMDDAYYISENVVPTMQWGSEIADTTIQDASWGKDVIKPERARILVGYSRRLDTQFHGGSVNSDLTNMINNAFSVGIEDALLQGSGASNEPTGLLTAITPTAVGALTLDKLVNLFELPVKQADALMGNLAYVGTPQVEAFMKYTQALPNGSRTLAQPGDEMHRLDNQMSTTGYPLYSTTVLGQTTPITAESLIFGNFNDLVIISFGGPVLQVNPYSRMNESIIEIYAERQMNIHIKRASSFVVATDVDVS